MTLVEKIVAILRPAAEAWFNNRELLAFEQLVALAKEQTKERIPTFLED